MASSTDRASRSRGMRPLPRPFVVATMLKVLGVLGLVAAVAWTIVIWVREPWASMSGGAKALASAEALGGGVTALAVLWVLGLLAQYCYHTALNIRLAERRHLSREWEGEASRTALAEPAGQIAEKVIALLREINENTLLTESDRARKRARLSDLRRDQVVTEINQLIAATKWPAARERIDDFRASYPGDEAGAQLLGQLERAVREHQEIDIMTASEQIRSYMSLGLWEKARATAADLARKYPGNDDARKMQGVVKLEEEGHRKEDRQRLYREIEHQVNRKHYRDARKVAETLIERFPESPEAATLGGQMDELSRNADIETRREMEAQIIDYSKQNRHREAYEVAKLLMEQWPESPQAVALREQIDRLRERAGAS